MGCGKSTVISLIKEMLPDHIIFDFDKYVHSLYEDPDVQVSLWLLFGTSDRRQISNIVYANPTEMARLEVILNRRISHKVEDMFLVDDIVFDMPLFFEYFEKYRDKVDGVVCVTCEPSIQRNRIRSRNGFTDEKIDQILAKQLPQDQKAKRSNVVIDNSGTVDDLRKQVVAFVEKGFT
jgi:dephospho-CoA kinase